MIQLYWLFWKNLNQFECAVNSFKVLTTFQLEIEERVVKI